MAQVLPNINPSWLYRYRALDKFEREIAAIESATLFCAAYDRLKDPMEGLYFVTKKLLASENYQKTIGLIANTKANLGICSFSKSNLNEIMWAHYANQYQGVCIEYRFSRLLEDLDEDVTFARMHYSERAPTAIAELQPERLAQSLLSYKNYRWFYEREWRMFGPHGEVHYNSVTCVRTVYLGIRITPQHQGEIKRRLEPLGIEVKKMSLDKYSMEFDTCE